MALKIKTENFMRSLAVVLISLIVTVIITGTINAKIKKNTIDNVNVSSEFLTEQITKKLSNIFANKKRVNFAFAKKVILPQKLSTFIPKGKRGEKKGQYSTGSVESIAIWKKGETGEILNQLHTKASLKRKNLYGLRLNQSVDGKNVKDYFKLKLENEWIEDKFDSLQEFEIENVVSVLKDKRRENIHAIRKFELKGEEYVLDFQYSKRSILETRITKSIQRVIIVSMFLFLTFLFVYALMFDKEFLMHVIVFNMLIFTLYPLSWVISLTFSTSKTLGGRTLNPIPKNASFDNYKAALRNLKKVDLNGVKLVDGKLFLGDEVKQEDKKPMVEEKNIKAVYNVFDPKMKNIYKKSTHKFKLEESQEISEYNGVQKKLTTNKYYIEFKQDTKLDKDMQIYNVEYYTSQNFLFMSGLMNSIFIAVATAMIGMILSSTAAYAFSRFRFPGRDGFMMSFLITQMFPNIMMLIPLYIIFGNLQLINTFRGLILAYSITALPFNIWNLKGFFDTIPVDLEEAALIDGCSASQTFYKIVLPLSLPSLAISGLFSFLNAWNEYIVAATFINEESKYTIPVVIKMLIGSNDVNWPMFATMSVLVSVPVIIVFLMTQKYLVGGLTAGGVKG